MVRPRKNKFKESSIKFEVGTEFEQNQVKLPFVVNVTYKIPISENKNGEKLYGSTNILIRKDISKKDEIVEDFEKEGKIVINVEEFAIAFSNLCPKCNRKGIPKIEGKSNKFDYHARSISPLLESPKHRVQVNRPYEHWLCYDHVTKPEKCRIAKWDKNHFIFTKNSKKYTKLRKYMFPNYIQWKKGELDDFDSFQKFINISHF